MLITLVFLIVLSVIISAVIWSFKSSFAEMISNSVYINIQVKTK